MADSIATEFDLLPKLVTKLDRHLIFPLLEFAAGQLEGEAEGEGENDNGDAAGAGAGATTAPSPEDAAKLREITRAKYELLKKTNMTDYVANLYCELEGLEEPPREYAEKRQRVISTLEKYEDSTGKLTELLQQEDVIANIRSDKVANLEFLKKEHGVTVDMVNALYDFGNFHYSCGDYGAAAELLFKFRLLSTDNDKVSAATWGRLASEILTTNWESALEEVMKVKEGIDNKLFNNPLAQLQHRTWLIHWALFPLFNYDPARDALLDLFFSPAYINTIQAACPWVLRYLAAAVITGRGRARNSGQHQKQLKDVVRIVRQEAYEYSDPVTEFVRALCVDFDFEDAQRQLAAAEAVLRADFFLAAAADAFVASARHLIFESYCKIHARIDVRGLSGTLGLAAEDGEKWIVNLIRDTRLDARIDYQEGTVVMNHPPSSVYQQVIERTKGGFFRTQVLNAAVAR